MLTIGSHGPGPASSSTPVKGRTDDLSEYDWRNLVFRFKKEAEVPQKLNTDYHMTQQFLSEIYIQQN